MRCESERPCQAIPPAFNRGRAGWAALWLMLALTSGAMRSAVAQHDAAAPFDIPAQPLAAALDAYSAATGLVAVYNGRLA